MRFVLALLSALFLLTEPNPARAHEVQPAIFNLNFEENGRFGIIAELNLEAVVADIGSEHEDTNDSPNRAQYDALRQLPPAELEARFRAMAQPFLDNLGLTFSGEKADLEIVSLIIPEIGDTALARNTQLMLSGTVPEGADTLTWAYNPRYGASILRIDRPGEETFAQFFAAGTESGPLSVSVNEPRSFWETASFYIYQGFVHIIPEGLDHILFVLGLFFLSQQWRPLLVQVTSFTIAHSITLALGLYGIFRLPPEIVEPLIALSIVYVAVENILTEKLHVWRPIIVFAFGLLHGMGFAGVLAEVGLQRQDFVTGLISFNIGVELGQLAVIALAFLAVGAFRNRDWYRPAIVTPASLAIAAMGAYWFVERTFL